MTDQTHLLHRNAGKNISLAGREEITVGRLYHDAEIVNDDNCSRKHFILTKDSSGWKLTNLSNYGTVVNGRILAINESVRLVHQDNIQASRQEFTFYESAAPTLPPSPGFMPKLAHAAVHMGEDSHQGKHDVAAAASTAGQHFRNQSGSSLINALLRSAGWLLHQSKLVVTSFISHVMQLLGKSNKAVRRYQLQSEALKNTLALGRRCYEFGLTDDNIKLQVSSFEAKIKDLKTANQSTKAVEAERDRLLVTLGSSILANNADQQCIHAEFMAAKSSDKALHDLLTCQEDKSNTRETLDKYRPFRLGVAYSLIGLLIFMFFSFKRISSNDILSVTHEDKVTKAVGLVVCGLQVKEATGAISDFIGPTGTCFAINSSGYLLTNKHVVEEIWNLMNATLLLERLRKEKLVEIKPTVWVFFGGEKFQAEILHISDKYDMAVLKTPRSNTPFFRLGDADQHRRGTRVIAAGFPGSAQAPLSVEEAVSNQRRRETQKRIELQFKPRDFEFITTDGTISRLTTEEGQDRRWIQHNASINPGNSGGPLLLENATVIGINTLLITNASGTFYSLSLPQLKAEIDKHVPGVRWE